MNISSKLKLIVVLTVFEISITLLSVFEISKGAQFHQLNLLHLKYISQFSDNILALENKIQIDVLETKRVITDIRQQAIDCIKKINFINVFMMRQIGTYSAVDICHEDIKQANRALLAVASFANQQITREQLLSQLKEFENIFIQHSQQFEKPVSDTVSFLMRTMIPIIIIISMFNIISIGYMSKSISSSIRKAINLLERNSDDKNLSEDIDKHVSGELQTLLLAARERLANEMLVAEVNQRLEKLVEQRTESLTQANAELAQFAYRASHDLKAPLSSSKLLTRFIVEDIQSGLLTSAIEDAQKIHGQMEKLEDLVVSILSLTEIDSLDNNVTEIELIPVIDEIQHRLSSVIELHNEAITCDVCLEHPFISDKVRVVQILENLISNAFKYRDDDKVEKPYVKVSLSEKTDSYQLSVQDNGIGIPLDRHDEVFQMFKRFHPKISFGSGLGLAIVKKHVDYLNGTILMQTSELGTHFIINIPKQVS